MAGFGAPTAGITTCDPDFNIAQIGGIVHSGCITPQTTEVSGRVVLLWVHGTVGEWDRAAQFVPPMAAFMVGIVIAT